MAAASWQAQAAGRVGQLRARMKGLTYGIYPNLSFLWSNTSFKVSHPRGPGKVPLRSHMPDKTGVFPGRRPQRNLRRGGDTSVPALEISPCPTAGQE